MYNTNAEGTTITRVTSLAKPYMRSPKCAHAECSYNWCNRCREHTLRTDTHMSTPWDEIRCVGGKERSRQGRCDEQDARCITPDVSRQMCHARCATPDVSRTCCICQAAHQFCPTCPIYTILPAPICHDRPPPLAYITRPAESACPTHLACALYVITASLTSGALYVCHHHLIDLKCPVYMPSSPYSPQVPCSM